MKHLIWVLALVAIAGGFWWWYKKKHHAITAEDLIKDVPTGVRPGVDIGA